jgi:hypothetical protein
MDVVKNGRCNQGALTETESTWPVSVYLQSILHFLFHQEFVRPRRAGGING